MFSFSVAWSGITFAESPACTEPTVTTAKVPGASSRETIVCRRVTAAHAVTTGSLARCGIEPWLPEPGTVTVTVVAVESTGPAAAPTAPPGSVVSTCWASATSTSGILSASPSSTMARAPAARSSPGWKTATIRPCQASGCSTRARTAPSSAVACTSWPQACERPRAGSAA